MNQENFVKLVTKTFFEHPEFRSSEQLLNYLKSAYGDLPEFGACLYQLKSDPKDDKYGIFTLTLPQYPSSLEFRLKKPKAYGGPKTEDYLDRVDLRCDAAIEYIKGANIPDNERKIKIEHLNILRSFIKEKIKNDCHLDPKILKRLKDNSIDASIHFERQHAKAIKYLSTFNEALINTLGDPNEPKKTKAALYRLETKIMSDKKRPIRITARSITIGTTRYYEVDTHAPVNALRTVSSAKKDETGVANWIKYSTSVYDENYEQLDHREAFRSASIVPHDILKASTSSRLYALDTARRNVLEHIIPQLAQDLLQNNPNAKDPLEINYEMLTLLSPIHRLVDALVDPDLTQFRAIRDALDHYQGRTFSVDVNGVERQVKFNSVYHNYGVNTARKFAFKAYDTNQKAYNEIIDRSLETLNKNLPSLYVHNVAFHDFLKKNVIDVLNKPPYTKEQAEKLSQYHDMLRGDSGLYAQMDKNSAILTKEEHARLLELNAKQMDKVAFTQEEATQFQELSIKFTEIYHKNIALKNDAEKMEEEIREIHAQRAKLRQDNFMSNLPQLENFLKLLEEHGELRDKDTIAHIRALVEFNKLIVAGIDALRGTQDKKNSRNYEIQCYIERLNKFNGWSFHQTCKSGKDRTNAAIVKQLVKSLLSLHEKRLIQGESEESEVKKTERELFVNGFQQGAGNDLCADNMKPGAQQTDPADFTQEASFAVMASKKVSQLQKGLNALPKLSEKEKERILTGLPYSPVDSPTQDKENVVPTLPKHPTVIGAQRRDYLLKDRVQHTKAELAHVKDTVISLNNRLRENPSVDYQTKIVGFNKMKINPLAKEGATFYAQSEGESMCYAANNAKQLNDAQLKSICAFMVKYAIDGSTIDLSNTNPKIQSRMHAILNETIIEAGKSDKLKVSLMPQPLITVVKPSS